MSKAHDHNNEMKAILEEWERTQLKVAETNAAGKMFELLKKAQDYRSHSKNLYLSSIENLRQSVLDHVCGPDAEYAIDHLKRAGTRFDKAVKSENAIQAAWLFLRDNS